MKVYNQLDPPGQFFEKNDLPSLTIPDQTYTISEILHRHSIGLGATGSEGMYEEDEEGNPLDMPDLRTMDIEEIASMRERNQREIDEMTKEIQLRQKEQKEKQLDEEMNKKVEARMEQRRKDKIGRKSPIEEQSDDSE